MKLVFRTTIIVYSISSHSYVIAADPATDPYPPNCDYNFELQARSDDTVPTDLSLAVVQIRDTSNRGLGTGYVIDLDHGYIITAHHVVKNFLNYDENLAITSTNFPDHESISANLVDELMTDHTIDLALLQSDGEQLSDVGVEALDLQMRIPVPSEHVGTMGYPENGSDSMNTHTGEVSYIYRFGKTFSMPDGKDRTEQRAEIVIAQDVWKGHSGSPLISRHNVVIGTAKSKIDDRQARYIPMSYAFRFIVRIAKSGISRKAGRISNILASPDATVSKLAKVLQSKITNLELMTWAIEASLEPSVGARVGRFLACPLQQVYSDRKIEAAYQFLAASVPGGQDLIPDVLEAEPQ